MMKTAINLHSAVLEFIAPMVLLTKFLSIHKLRMVVNVMIINISVKSASIFSVRIISGTLFLNYF